MGSSLERARIAEDVLSAARSFGERNLDEHAIGDLIEGKLTEPCCPCATSASSAPRAVHRCRGP
jgi:hypothetical protein